MKKNNYWIPAVLFAAGLLLGMIGLSAFDGEPGEAWFHLIGWPMAAVGIGMLIWGQPSKKNL